MSAAIASFRVRSTISRCSCRRYSELDERDDTNHRNSARATNRRPLLKGTHRRQPLTSLRRSEHGNQNNIQRRRAFFTDNPGRSSLLNRKKKAFDTWEPNL